jgi:hypothetical protein
MFVYSLAKGARRGYVGLDISSFCVALARYRFQHWPEVNIMHTVHDRFGVDGVLQGSVSAVVAVNFFYHQSAIRAEKIIRRCAEWLMPGGWMLVDQYPSRIPLGSEQPAGWDGPERLWPDYHIGRDRLEEVAADLGFTVEAKIGMPIPLVQDMERDFFILRKTPGGLIGMVRRRLSERV